MKNESIRKVINVDKPNFSTVWSFKQEDDGVLRLSLFKGSTALDITGQAIKLGVLRADKTLVELEDQSCFRINNNELDITLKNNILSIQGIAECDLTLADASGKMTTASFFIEVKKKTTGLANILGANLIEGLEKLKNDFKINGDKLISAFSKEYDSLKRIIIDENQAANLQDQVNQTNAQLETKVDLSDFNAEKVKIKVLENTNTYNIRNYCFKTNQKLLDLQPVKIVCLGDSNTYGRKTTDGTQTENPYPKVLENRLKEISDYLDITVLNKGINGNTTFNMYSRFNSDVVANNPDMVIIMTGTNDCIQGIPESETRWYLYEMVRMSKEKGYDVILMTQPTLFLNTNDNNAISSINNYANVIKEIGRLTGSLVVDNLSFFNYLYNSDCELEYDLQPDDTHFIDRGYAYITDNILYNAFTLKYKTVNDVTRVRPVRDINNRMGYMTIVGTLYSSDDLKTKKSYALKKGENSKIVTKLICNKKTKLSVIAIKINIGGSIDVLDNGVVIATVDTNSSSRLPNQIIDIANLKPGYHKIEFIASNIKENDKYFYFQELLLEEI